MSDYIDLTLDIFDEDQQRVSVRRSLTGGELIGEIVREFEDIADDNAGGYALTLKEGNKLLESTQTLRDQGITDGDTLMFSWARGSYAQGRRSVTRQAALNVVGRDASFPITWQPALIGRTDTDPLHAQLLAANIEWLPNSRRVSRRQAQLTETDGVYYLEGLAEQNATYLNGNPLPANMRTPLRHGDRIALGHSRIELQFVTK